MSDSKSGGGGRTGRDAASNGHYREFASAEDAAMYGKRIA